MAFIARVMRGLLELTPFLSSCLRSPTPFDHDSLHMQLPLSSAIALAVALTPFGHPLPARSALATLRCFIYVPAATTATAATPSAAQPSSRRKICKFFFITLFKYIYPLLRWGIHNYQVLLVGLNGNIKCTEYIFKIYL